MSEVLNVSEVKTRPLGEPLAEAELAIEQPQPTIFEPAYWDQDDERLYAAFDEIVDKPLNKMEQTQFAEFVNLVWSRTLENRLRQKELALKMGEMSLALEALKPKPKKTRVPKAALPAIEPEASDAA